MSNENYQLKQAKRRQKFREYFGREPKDEKELTQGLETIARRANSIMIRNNIEGNK